MKLLMLGGSFNPIHIGHLMLAEEIAHEFFYDKIIFVPSFIPPHKVLENDPGAMHRFEMTKLAIGNNSQFLIDSAEIERAGISYTIDTVKELSSKYKLTDKLGLIIGDDLLRNFDTWKDAFALSNCVDLIVARRIKESTGFAYRHMRANNLLLDISSTDIRNRVAHSRPWEWLVPDAVKNYIIANKLYVEKNSNLNNFKDI